MRNTVADLKTDVGTILTGIDLDLVSDFYGSAERAVKTLIQKADVPEASIRQPIMLYSGVTYYTPDNRMFGTALIDVRPQAIDQRNSWDDVAKKPIEMFNRNVGRGRLPWGYMCTFEYHEGDPIMGIAQSKTEQQISIDSMSDTDGWAVGGNGTNLVLDNTVYYHSPGALRFNLGAGGQATLIKTLDNSLDLERYEGVGVSFLAAYIPEASEISSITLRLGSSSGDYWQVVATEGFLGAFVSNEFQLVAFDLSEATTVGSPDASAIDYVEILVDYAGTQNNVRFGDLWISLPTPHEMLFYSAAAFKPADATAFQTTIDEDTDEIIFRDAAYNIYVQEVAREVAKNEGGTVGSGTIAAIDIVLEGGGDKLGLYEQFRGDNPSEEIRQVGSYYYDEGENLGGF